jgi:hypothetical protein
MHSAHIGVRIGRGADDRELGGGLFRIVGIGAGQRPRFPARGGATRRAHSRRARIIVADAAGLEQFGDHAFVDRAVLPHVERGEVEAEGLDRADQPAERAAAGELAGALRRRAARDRDEVLAEAAEVGIGLTQAEGAAARLPVSFS